MMSNFKLYGCNRLFCRIIADGRSYHSGIVFVVEHSWQLQQQLYHRKALGTSSWNLALSSSVVIKLAKKNAQRQPQKPRTAFSFINNNLIYNSFVYPVLGDKVAYSIVVDLPGVGSFSLSR